MKKVIQAINPADIWDGPYFNDYFPGIIDTKGCFTPPGFKELMVCHNFLHNINPLFVAAVVMIIYLLIIQLIHKIVIKNNYNPNSRTHRKI